MFFKNFKDGLELLVLMQSYDNFRDIPVIMMLGHGNPRIVSQCLRNGAKDCLIKPIRIANVKQLSTHVTQCNKGRSKNKFRNLILEQYERIKLVR